MNRRQARENAFNALFASMFGNDIQQAVTAAGEGELYQLDEFGINLLNLYETHESEVNLAIQANLKGWVLNRVSKVNLAILRLAVAELMYGEPDMDSIIINEAVELAKRFGHDEDYQFVNGVLGSISRGEKS